MTNGSGKLMAVEHLASDESVVKSGVALADAVLKSLSPDRKIIVSFEGLRGASSSYFNVFLRRIQEGCGLAEIGDHIVLEFGSAIQEMIYNRSLNAIAKGPRNATDDNSEAELEDVQNRSSETHRASVLVHLIKTLGRLLRY